MTEDEKFMKAALVQAKKAAAIDEVPIGCVIVYEGRSLPGDIINATRRRIPCPMRR